MTQTILEIRKKRAVLSQRLSSLALISVMFIAHTASAQDLEWPTYGGDLASTRYSPLDQINRENFNELELAWKFDTRNLGPTPEYNLQSTPLMVNRTLYSTAGSRRDVVALDAQSGELLWVYRIDEGERGANAPSRLSGRGLAFWDDGTDEGRIVYVTPGYRMIALDAATGRPIEDFGEGGIVDLKLEMDQDIDLIAAPVDWRAAPIIANGIIVIGSGFPAGGVPPSKENPKGHIRGYDARTGERLWIFHAIPLEGEYGNETWLEDSWTYTGNGGVWTQMSVDTELNMLYLPTEVGTGDYYGGHRPGDNLFSNSIVALDLSTGVRKWHFQTVHHDVWDFDLPCAPILVDLTMDGRNVPAIAQASKQGFVYILDRVTGEPLFDIVERPVPTDGVPGEHLSPTQPFPVAPPPFERQGISVDELIDFTPELRARALEVVSRYRIGPLFTPPSLDDDENGKYGTLNMPSSNGGTTWPGGAVDPETGIFYIFSKAELTRLSLGPNPRLSDMDYVVQRSRNAPDTTIDGMPLLKPPYGTITAIDLNKGEILWQVAHGETPDVVRNHPALQGMDIPRTGQYGRVGTLVTKSLVIAGDGGSYTNDEGETEAMLRAYDKLTGAELGAIPMPAQQTGSPMTYAIDGVQYLAVAIGGSDFPGHLMVYKYAD